MQIDFRVYTLKDATESQTVGHVVFPLKDVPRFLSFNGALYIYAHGFTYRLYMASFRALNALEVHEREAAAQHQAKTLNTTQSERGATLCRPDA